MANRKIKHITATLTGASSAETFDVMDENACYLYGKHIVAYGDSTGASPYNYVNKLINDYGLDITNRCVGGSLATKDYTDMPAGKTIIPAATDLNNFDICLIIYSINDWQMSMFMPDYALAYETICGKFNDLDCEPIFIFPWYCHRSFDVAPSYSWTSDANRLGIDLCNYVDTAIDVVSSHGFKYINMYTASGVNQDNYTHWLTNDSGIYVHANTALADRACRTIMANTFNNGKYNDYQSPNYGGYFYNNVNFTVNTQYKPRGYCVYFQKNLAYNALGIRPLYNGDNSSPRHYKIHVKGHIHSTTDYVQIVGVMSTGINRTITVVSGADFDFCIYGYMNYFSLGVNFPDSAADTSVAMIDALEVYCNEVCFGDTYATTLRSGVTDTIAPYMSVHDGKLTYSPNSLTISTSIAVENYLIVTPIWPTGTQNIGAGLLVRGSTKQIVPVYLNTRYIVCGVALQSGDKLSFKLPDVQINPSNVAHG